MFEKYDRTAKDVITALSIHTDGFYLTHKYDKRGRVYCQGYHINYQGAPWNKATIQLADKELVE
jgi:DNA-directed RNA polymerase